MVGLVSYMTLALLHGEAIAIQGSPERSAGSRLLRNRGLPLWELEPFRCFGCGGVIDGFG